MKFRHPLLLIVISVVAFSPAIPSPVPATPIPATIRPAEVFDLYVPRSPSSPILHLAQISQPAREMYLNICKSNACDCLVKSAVITSCLAQVFPPLRPNSIGPRPFLM